MKPILRRMFRPGRRRSPASFCTLLFLAASIGFANSQDGKVELANIPLALVGTWKIESVLVDLGSSRRLLYQRDDPRLLSKQIMIGSLKIVSDTLEARECLMPKAAAWKTTASSLVATTLAPHGVPGFPPTVKDYGLPLAPDAQVDAYSVKCNPGRFGPAPLGTARAAIGSRDLGTWIVILPSGDLAVRWYDQTILLLRRSQ
jgi:hypothetical protein